MNRMKCHVSDEAIRNRLMHRPDILEFHLVENDLYGKGLKVLEQTITRVQAEEVKVYLHHPMSVDGKLLHIISREKEIRNFYQESSGILGDLAQRYDLKVVVHCNYNQSEMIPITNDTMLELKEEIQCIHRVGNRRFLWEDSCGGMFSYANPRLMEEIVYPLQLPLVQDVSHTFIALGGDNEKLLEVVRQVFPYVEYYHVVDSTGGPEHDGLELGKGKINWSVLKSYITQRDYIFEVGLRDVNNCEEMVRSAAYFNSVVVQKRV